MNTQAENKDESWTTHASAMVDAIWNALAVLGMIAFFALVALHQAGFFTWAADNLPNHEVLQFFFGRSK